MFRKKRRVGLIVNSRDLTLVALRKKGKYVLVEHLEKISISPGLHNDGLILDRAALVQALAPVVRQSRLKGARATVTVNPRQAIIRSLRMPLMPEKELPAAVYWEISRLSSMANTPFAMDYFKLGKAEMDGTAQQELLLMAVKESTLNELCLLASEAGLKVKAVDLEPMAFLYLRHFAAGKGDWPVLEDAWASLYFGENRTMVAFYQGLTLQFVHTIPLVYSNDTAGFSDLLREVRRSFDYYHVNLKKPLTRAVYLWGKESSLALSGFQEALGYPVAHLALTSLEKSVKYSAGPPDDSWVVALGMALREVV